MDIDTDGSEYQSSFTSFTSLLGTSPTRDVEKKAHTPVTDASSRETSPDQHVDQFWRENNWTKWETLLSSTLGFDSEEIYRIFPS
jgi:hypothetical protein